MLNCSDIPPISLPIRGGFPLRGQADRHPSVSRGLLHLSTARPGLATRDAIWALGRLEPKMRRIHHLNVFHAPNLPKHNVAKLHGSLRKGCSCSST